MAELFNSFYHFFSGILKRFLYWAPFLFLDVIDAYDKYIKKLLPHSYEEAITAHIPSNIGLLVFSHTMLWAAMLTYHELRLKVDNSLKIDFKEREGSYFQENRIDFSQEIGTISEYFATLQLYRIRIYNAGTQVIDNVQVKLTSIDPHPNDLKGIPFNLHFMNDNKSPFDTKKQLASGQDEYIDVVTWVKGGYPRGMISIEHVVPGIEKFIEPRNYEIIICVTGNNVVAVEKKFNIFIDNKREIQMNLIEG